MSMNVNRNGTMSINTHSNPHILYTKSVIENLPEDIQSFDIKNVV